MDIVHLYEQVLDKIDLYQESVGFSELKPCVLKALQTVPREHFVDEHFDALAFDDKALPIGYGQSISQPFLVAVMTELLNVEPEHTVLEIGTGSGYQSAILGHLAGLVHSLEIFPCLAEIARQRLGHLNLNNVNVLDANGFEGCEQFAPFDGIIITAASATVPETLLEQLSPGGRLIMPLGHTNFDQKLNVIEKTQHGTIVYNELFPVSFVPMRLT